MPAPIVHIVLSLLILPYIPDKNPKEFIIGASFPDIRYLGVINRNETHNQSPSWEQVVKEESAFRAGVEFHALVDILHDWYMGVHNVYKLLPVQCKSNAYYLKFFEDMMLYAKCSQWNEIAAYFDSVLKDELDLVHDRASIELWHNKVKQYLLKKPSPQTVAQFLDIKILRWYGPFFRVPIKIRAYSISSTLSEILGKLLSNKELCASIFNFYEQFPHILKMNNGLLHIKLLL